MICTQCHHDKVPYEFAVASLICFDCSGNTPCCECGVVQPSTHYRVMGRMCVDCRNARSGVLTGKLARAYVRDLNSVEIARIAHSDEKRVA